MAFVVLDLSVVRVSRRIRVQFLGSVDVLVILLWDLVVVSAPSVEQKKQPMRMSVDLLFSLQFLYKDFYSRA